MEHLQWCKDRALSYVKTGDLQGAFASMTSDMSKHPETDNPTLAKLGFKMMFGGHLDTSEKMRKWINGYN